MSNDKKGFVVDIIDYIDVALVIMAKTKDRDILDFYLDLNPGTVSESDMERFLYDKEFLVSGYNELAKNIDELRDILKENKQWV
jgi:hypothetical protein